MAKVQYDQLLTEETLVGSSEGDQINALNEKSIIYGGLGDDELSAIGKSDTLLGGSGSDNFTFAPKKSGAYVKHIIADFNPEQDTINFSDVVSEYGEFVIKGFSKESLTGDGNELLFIPDCKKYDLEKSDIYKEKSSTFKKKLKNALGERPDIYSTNLNKDSSALRFYNEGNLVYEIRLASHKTDELSAIEFESASAREIASEAKMGSSKWNPEEFTKNIIDLVLVNYESHYGYIPKSEAKFVRSLAETSPIEFRNGIVDYTSDALDHFNDSPKVKRRNFNENIELESEPKFFFKKATRWIKNSIIDPVADAAKFVGDGIITIGQTIGDVVVDGITTIGNGLEIAVNGVIKFTGSAAKFFEDAASSVISVFGDVADVVFKVGANVFDTLITIAFDSGSFVLDMWGTILDAKGNLISALCEPISNNIPTKELKDLIGFGCDLGEDTIRAAAKAAGTASEIVQIAKDLASKNEIIYNLRQQQQGEFLKPQSIPVPGSTAKFEVGPYIENPIIGDGFFNPPQLVNFKPKLSSEFQIKDLYLKAGARITLDTGSIPFNYSDKLSLTNNLGKSKTYVKPLKPPFINATFGYGIDIKPKLEVKKKGLNKTVDILNASIAMENSLIEGSLLNTTQENSSVANLRTGDFKFTPSASVASKDELTGINGSLELFPNLNVGVGLGFGIPTGNDDTDILLDVVNLSGAFGPRIKGSFDEEKGVALTGDLVVRSDLNFLKGKLPGEITNALGFDASGSVKSVSLVDQNLVNFFEISA